MYWGIVSILDHKLPKHCTPLFYIWGHCALRTITIHRAHPTDVHSDIVLHWSWGFSGNWSGEVFSFLRTTIHGEAADLGGKGEIGQITIQPISPNISAYKPGFYASARMNKSF